MKCVFDLRPCAFIVLGAVLFLFAVPCEASAADGSRLTLEACLKQALSSNRQLQAARFAAEKANWDRRNAWSQFAPRVSFNTEVTRIDEQTLAERDFSRYFPPEIPVPQVAFRTSYYSSFQAHIPIFDAELINGLSVATTGQAAAERTREAIRDRILLQVTTGYVEVLKRGAMLELQREFLVLTGLNVEKAERMHRAGRYSKLDLLRWQVEHQGQKSSVAAGESALRDATVRLRRLLNLRTLHADALEDRVPDRIEAEVTRVAGLSEAEIRRLAGVDSRTLVDGNAMLAAAEQDRERSRLVYRGQYSSYLPDVSLSYSTAWRRNDTLALDEYRPSTVMLNLSVPLFTGFRNLSRLKSAQYSYRAQDTRFSDLIDETRQTLGETVNRIVNLKTQRELIRTSLDFNENNYRIVSREKEMGRVSNLDVIDAKLNLQNARLLEITTQFDLTSAVIELSYLMGSLDDLVEEIVESE
ncbi:MAG: TolC family protein [Gemmatimonadetes bacterium]|nr:TolC family protein [Gemmatimonadota bacterium]